MQVFIKSTAESLSFIASKVLLLEQAVCTINGEDVDNEKESFSVSSIPMKKNVEGSSSKHSTTCTPRPSVEIHDRHAPVMLQSRKKAEIWEEKVASGSRLSNSLKRDLNMWGSSPVSVRSYLWRDTQNCRGQTPQNTLSDITRELSNVSSSTRSKSNGRLTGTYYMNNLRRCVKDFICDGDLDSAYAEALHSGNESILIELLNGTGPVLEGISQNTATDVLHVLASYFVEQRYVWPIIPWLQQASITFFLYGICDSW